MSTKCMLAAGLCCLLAASHLSGASAEERGVFDYQKQFESSQDVKKIVFIADAQAALKDGK